MGSGVPTTPTYIILASIVAPALAQLGVPQLATHFFVFYFGVLADVTPPVALAAFAAAGIARSEPMRTGMTAFRLSMGKALVPFAFVYTPALLFIDFTWVSFVIALAARSWRIMGLGAAYTGFCGGPIGIPAFLALNVLSLSLPGMCDLSRCRRPRKWHAHRCKSNQRFCAVDVESAASVGRLDGPIALQRRTCRRYSTYREASTTGSPACFHASRPPRYQ
jgi:hypothetical protein